MARELWGACVLLWILAHEREDPEDGEERAIPEERIATPCESEVILA